MKLKQMRPETQELGEILRFQESLLRLVAMNPNGTGQPAPVRKQVAAERIAEMARKLTQAS